jgi:hypothetical protein
MRVWLGLGFLTLVLALPAWANIDAYRYAAWEIKRPQFYRDYNFKAGPVYFDLKGLLAVTYDSNITRVPEGEISDIFFYPQLRVAAMWEYSQVNVLTLNVGFGYQKYLENSQLDSSQGFLNLSPDSELAFTVSTGNLTLQVFDGFGYLTDATNTVGIGPGGEPITSAGRYGRFINRLGVRGFYPLNLVDMRFEFSRIDEVPDSGDLFDFRRHHEYLGRISLERDFAANMRGGLGFTYSDITYAEQIQNSGTSFSAGPFLNWNVSRYVVLQGGISYVWRDFDTTGSIGDTTNNDGWAYNLELFHDMNRHYNHSLLASRFQGYGFVSNSQEIDRLSYRFSLNVLKDWRFNGDVYWESGGDSGGQFAEDYERWGANLRTSRSWGDKFLTRFYISYSDKESSEPIRSYDRFLAGVEFEYDF